MKLKDLKISQQINIGLSIILALVLLIGTLGLVDSNSLWQNTKDLYEHPLTVQRAIGQVEADVLNMRLEMKELVLVGNLEQIQDRFVKLNSLEADAYRHLDIIYNAYLGPKRDIDNVANALLQLKTLREETIRLFRAGKFDEASSQVSFQGVIGLQGAKVISELAIINTFATNKADEFYLTAKSQQKQSFWQLLLLMLGILMLAGTISFVLRKGILTPLRELTAVNVAFQKGQLDTRSRYTSKNEFGMLSNAFNAMASTVQTEIENKDRLAKVSSSMFYSDDLQLFCQELLQTLMKYTDSQLGAVYLLDEEQQIYEHFASIGMNIQKRLSFAALAKEGEFGLAVATGKLQHLTSIPADAQLDFSTVSGNFKTREIITIPILQGTEVIAVISLASLKNYPSSALWLVNSLVNEIAARMNSILAAQKVLQFSHKLQAANLELEQQTQELSMQSEELREQNIELELQGKQLSIVSQLKSSFLSNMSHELRTPLNSVIALASVLGRRLENSIPTEEYSYLEVIERNGKHLLALVNDILDLSRIEAGKEELKMSNFNLRLLVDEIAEMLAPQVEKKVIKLNNMLAQDLPDVFSDKKKCRHILQNIIGNAVKFTDEGEVAISALVENAEIRLLISDTGIGVSPEQLAFIFDEFRQADESPSRRNGGTGLGLAIAKKYAELLGGTITVASILGKGSVFTIKLPLVYSDELQSESDYWEVTPKITTNTEQAGTCGNAKHILLVEDSEPAIIQTRDLLQEQGYHITVARNGKEALAQIMFKQPDGIMLDLMMPEMDGFEVLKAIRDDDKFAHIPVLILSAKHISKEDLSVLKSNHIQQLIQKGGIDKKDLLTAVARLVESGKN